MKRSASGTRPGTALLLLAVAAAVATAPGLAGAQSAPPGGARPDAAKLEAAKKEAGALANKALEDFTQGRYDWAISGFEDADKAFHSPKFLIYAARAHVKLGHLRAAKGVYERIVGEQLAQYAPADWFAVQGDAKKELEELKSRIAAEEARSAAPTASASAPPDAPSASTDVRGADSGGFGSEPSSTAPPPDAASSGRPIPKGSIIAFGGAALGLVVTGVFGGLTIATHGDYDRDRKASPLDPKKVNGDADRGNAFAAAADVGLAALVVGAAVGTFVWVVSGRSGGAPRAALRVTVAPSGGGVSVGGAF